MLHRGILLRNKWYTVMIKNVYLLDNVMFILKTNPGLTVSVLVYSFSLRSLVFLSSVGCESCPHSNTLATLRLYRLLLWHHVVLVEVVVGHHLPQYDRYQ